MICAIRNLEFIVLNEHHVHDRSKIYTRSQGPSKNMELYQSKKEQECNNKVPVVIICSSLNYIVLKRLKPYCHAYNCHHIYSLCSQEQDRHNFIPNFHYQSPLGTRPSKVFVQLKAIQPIQNEHVKSTQKLVLVLTSKHPAKKCLCYKILTAKVTFGKGRS